MRGSAGSRSPGEGLVGHGAPGRDLGPGPFLSPLHEQQVAAGRLPQSPLGPSSGPGGQSLGRGALPGGAKLAASAEPGSGGNCPGGSGVAAAQEVAADGCPPPSSRSWRRVPSAHPRSVAVAVRLLSSCLCHAVLLS